MSPVSAMPAEEVDARHKGLRSGRLAVIVIVVVACAALCAIPWGASRQWPLAQTRVLQDLREASDSEVIVRAFHERYFPTPGCIMEGVVFHHGNAEAKPLITIEKVTIRASYLGLLSQRVSRITAEGMRVFIPAFGTGELFHTARSQITVDEIVANVKASRAPMSGSVRFEGRAEIPPGKQRFLEKMKLLGGFGIEGGTFAKPSTQEGVDKLSPGARGEKDPADPETVLSDLKGQVNFVAGTARFSDPSFGVPGAAARMKGTDNLISHNVDLRDQLEVDSKISNTTSGPKAFLLKIYGAVFQEETQRRNGSGAKIRDFRASDVWP
jgi:hypothetical protein